MNARSPRRFGRALALALLVLYAPSAGAEARRASADFGLRASEREQLLAGSRVERPLSFGQGKGSYVGGIAYQVVNRAPSEVLSALLDVRRLPEMLPRTRSARLISTEGGRSRIELEQGQAPFVARYTVVLERVPGADELRFWLDPSAPHDIRDVWGFFRVQELASGGSLLTVGAAVDLGPGLFAGLFTRRVQKVVLHSVTGIRDFMEPRRVALVGY